MTEIVVTAHAVERATGRYRLNGAPVDVVRRRISEEVRAAVAAGRVRNHKIDGFLLYHEKRKQLPPGKQFVYSADEQHAWIVVRQGDADVVVTSLSRPGVRR